MVNVDYQYIVRVECLKEWQIRLQGERMDIKTEVSWLDPVRTWKVKHERGVQGESDWIPRLYDEEKDGKLK